MTEDLHAKYTQKVIDAVKNISMQVDGLQEVQINSELMLLGEQSPFDSFSILLLLVELEPALEKNSIENCSLVDWFSNLDFSDNSEVNLHQFASLLLNDYFRAENKSKV